MARAKKTFTAGYRDEAVKMVIEGSRPIAQVARELGINDGTPGELGECLSAGASGRGGAAVLQ